MKLRIVDLFKSAKAFMEREEYVEALGAFSSALECEPDDVLKADIYYYMGICKNNLEDYGAAEEKLKTALDTLKIRDYKDKKHIYNMLHVVYMNSLEWDKLIDLCHQIKDYDENAVTGLMYAYVKAKRWEDQLELLNELEDTKDNTLYRIQCLRFLGRYGEGIAEALKYIDTVEEDRDVCEHLMEMYYGTRDPEKGLRYFKKAMKRSDDPRWRVKITGVMLSKDIYQNAADGEDYLDIIRSMERDSRTLECKRIFASTLKPFRKLRLGYLSADLSEHPGGYFLLPVMINSVKSHSFIKVYSLMPHKLYGNTVQEQIQDNIDEWADVYEKPDEYIEQMYLDDRIDIAFDLMGHTANNRIELVARRLAPIQISWICFPVTAGLSSMDYVLADPYAAPIEPCGKYYVEKILHMPKTYLCYPLLGEPEVGEPAFLRNGHITFACFHNMVKITDKTLRMWRRILERVEDAVLKVVGHVPPGEENYDRVVEQFRRNGMPMERVTISRAYAFSEYYAAYNDVDIMLDTYPFNGATTTFDAFKMATPIITLAGERHVSRVCYSMLKNVGLEELAAFTEDEYVEKAVALANDPERLQRISRELPERARNSALVDQVGFRRDFEKTIRGAWIAHCLEKRDGVWDYSGDGLQELMEQAMNATVYFERVLEAGESIPEALTAEYHLLQKALYDKLRPMIEDTDFMSDYERLVGFTGRSLSDAELKAVLGLARRYLEAL